MKNKYGQIYMITNKIDGKVYIGKTVGRDVLKDRYNGNLLSTHNLHLKNSILKYEIQNFEISTLCWANSNEELGNKEKEYILKYDAMNDKKGYNMHEGGQGGRMSAEINLIIGEKSKEFWDSHSERKLELAKSMVGENNFLVKLGGHNDETKLKMSNSRKQLLKDHKDILDKSLEACNTPQAIRNRVISQSKFWNIQYDLGMNELNRFHTMKDMYNFMIKNNIETNITYGGFKNKSKLNKVFGEHQYKGFYWRKIGK